MIAIRNDRAHGERRADPDRVSAARAEADSIWSALLQTHPMHEPFKLWPPLAPAGAPRQTHAAARPSAATCRTRRRRVPVWQELAGPADPDQ